MEFELIYYRQKSLIRCVLEILSPRLSALFTFLIVSFEAEKVFILGKSDGVFPLLFAPCPYLVIGSSVYRVGLVTWWVTWWAAL